MTQSQIQQTIAQYRQYLLQREAQAVQALLHAYQQTLATIQPRLNMLYREVNTKLQAGEVIPLSWLYEGHRLASVKQFITHQLNHYGVVVQVAVGQLQHFAVGLGTQAAQTLLQTVFGQGEGVHPTPSVIANLVGATQAGSPLADLFKGFGEEAAQGAGEALIRGVTLGSSVQTMARDVEQALDVSRSRALTIARTETMRPYRAANIETYRASGLVEQWRWVAAKRGRTCAVCLAMDGTLHDLGEEMGSHPNCRCTMIPVRTGSTMSYQSGVNWLDEQSEAIQQEVLGAKYKGWANGDFTLHDMVGHSHDEQWGGSIYEKSLKQLVKAR